MRPRKPLLSIVGISLGGLGIVLCVAAMIGNWMASARLDRLTENVASNVDRALGAMQRRAGQSQERLAAAAITAGELETMLGALTRQEVAQRLILRVNATEKAERLVITLQQ